MITVSAGICDQLASLHDKPVYVVYNGYDSEDQYKAVSAQRIWDEARHRKFTLTYTGMVYSNKQDPAPVFAALDGMLLSREITSDEIVLKFFGRNLRAVSESLRRFTGLEKIVQLNGEIGYEESLQQQISADALLFLEWCDPRARFVLTGKIFEYLASGRPILAVGPRGGEVDRLLQETGAGVMASNTDEVEETLLHWIKEFRRVGRLQAMTNDLAKRYDRRTLTGQLAEIFNNILVQP
jgi:glycosyltransferase involved in cell wall biosynthesis